MNMSKKTITVATLAIFALSGCDISSNTDDDSLGVRDELSSKQGDANGGGSSLPAPDGDPMPPPEYVYPNYEPDTTKYVKEPLQQQPINPAETATWSLEVDKWIVEQVMLDPNEPKKQEEREVWLVDDDGLFSSKLVITADGIRKLGGGFKVIFPDEYVGVK